MSETKEQLIGETKVKPLQELSQIELSKLHAKNENRYKSTCTEESNTAMEEYHSVIEESLAVKEGLHTVLDDSSAKDETLLEIYGPQYEKPTSFVFNASFGSREIHKDTFACYFNMGAMARNLGGGGEQEISQHTQEQFQDPKDRNHFVRIVFMILALMMLVTFIGVFCINHFFHHLFHKYGLFIMIGSAVGLMLLSYVWAFIPASRLGACAYVLLGAEVVLSIAFCGAVTVRYKTTVIIIALACLVVLVLLCVALACTKFDFTSFYLYVVMAMMALAVISLGLMFVTLVLKIRIPILMLVLTVIGLLVQTALFVMELQMIFGGKSIELDNTDYALGAYMLYTSIIQLFLHILRIVGFAESH